MAERDELGDITDQGPWEREDEHQPDEGMADDDTTSEDDETQ